MQASLLVQRCSVDWCPQHGAGGTGGFSGFLGFSWELA
jgi:hypothetical protein